MNQAQLQQNTYKKIKSSSVWRCDNIGELKAERMTVTNCVLPFKFQLCKELTEYT
jgi:hypothetical protein